MPTGNAPAGGKCVDGQGQLTAKAIRVPRMVSDIDRWPDPCPPPKGVRAANVPGSPAVHGSPAPRRPLATACAPSIAILRTNRRHLSPPMC